MLTGLVPLVFDVSRVPQRAQQVEEGRGVDFVVEVLGSNADDFIFSEPVAESGAFCHFFKDDENGGREVNFCEFGFRFFYGRFVDGNRPGHSPFWCRCFTTTSAPGTDGIAFPALFPQLLFVGFDLVRFWGWDR